MYVNRSVSFGLMKADVKGFVIVHLYVGQNIGRSFSLGTNPTSVEYIEWVVECSVITVHPPPSILIVRSQIHICKLPPKTHHSLVLHPRSVEA